jgi:hypothetical protein
MFARNKISTVAFVIMLLVATFMARLPTLFNDFYDVDELAAIVQAQQYLAGDIPGIDFSESKNPLFHAIFKASYKLDADNGWVIVHIITILIIFLTSLFIYLTGKLIFSKFSAQMAAFLYVLLISSFNRHFMATNGEIVFNLPVIMGIYFYVKSWDYTSLKRYTMIFLALLCSFAAYEVKLHGIVLLLLIVFHILIYLPYHNNKINKKYILYISIAFACILCSFIIDYFLTKSFAPKIFLWTMHKLWYATARGLDPLKIIIRFTHRQGMLLLWHMVVWLPVMVYCIQLIKQKGKAATIKESIIAYYFIVTYLMIFAGGMRLYFHYFMATYPALVLLASHAIETYTQPVIQWVRKHYATLLLIPVVFFFMWNVKDCIIKHYYPNAFYNEGKVLYWTRAILVGTFNDYLLPDSSYKNAAEYIASITKPDDRIFVWGDGPYLYYFSKRKPAIFHMWPKLSILLINKLYDVNTQQSIEEARGIEEYFVNMLKKMKPVIFVDTSDNGLTEFIYPVTPVVKEYLEKHYTYIYTIDNMHIWKLKKP